MVFATVVVFQRAFGPIDRNIRPVTRSQNGTLDWIDGYVGPNASVTMIPFPISTNWFVNDERWVDFEFFNKSVSADRAPGLRRARPTRSTTRGSGSRSSSWTRT